ESMFYYTITAADNLSNEVKSQPSAPFSSMSGFPREHPLLVVRIWDTRFGGPLTQETEALLGNGGVQYDVWDQVKLTKLAESDLTPYDPRNPGVLLSPSLQNSAEGRVVLDDFLDCGGKLLLQQIPNLFLDFYPEGRALFSDYLHTFIIGEPAIARTIAGVEGDPIGDGIALTVRGYQELVVVPPAVPFLTTRGGTPVAVRIEDKGYKAVYFGFSLDAISEYYVEQLNLQPDDIQQQAAARKQLLLRALQWLDSSVTSVEEESHAQVVPKEFGLSQNFPNPFNPTTEIRFALPEAGHVQLSVFNLLGQEIRVLAEGFRELGTYRVRWDGKDGHGLEAATGVYLVRLEAGSFSATRRMVLIK
ncbi:MAG: T9SS type A sorting domain-containing protein, partial [Candidatus Latescibacteria bacterium]|nr:T9SS type A sorting domain-containing protein [Candidatus Latescibacterota bacterium]